MIDETFLTTEEVLEYLQVNLRTVYRLIKAGKIPAVRVGRQWRFRKRDIDAWLDSQRPRGGARPAAAATAATGRAAGAGAGLLAPRGRWLSSHASMSRLRKRHWRPTRTAGIFPALISRYTVRRLTWRYSRTSSVVRNVSSIMRQRPGDGAIGNSTVNTAPPFG